MGRRGPRPKPTAELLQIGNKDALRRRQHEPRPEAGSPGKPSNLSEVAAIVWDHYALMLENVGILTIVDGIALQQLCECFSEWFKYDQAIRESGATYTTPSGMIRVRPEVRLRTEARRDLLRLLKEFGLTPASRPSVRAVETGNADTTDCIT